MSRKKIYRILFILIVVLTSISCDQISKNAVREKINHHEKIEVISNYVYFTKVENTGAFLSLGDKIPRSVYIILMIISPIIIISYILYYLYYKENLSKIVILGFCLIAGGGIGNIIDRIKFGSVTDFMHIDFVLFKTGIFNMADLSIMTGTVIILFSIYRTKQKLSF